MLGKIASPKNSQKLSSWFHSFQRGSFCEFLGDAIFPSTFLKKQTLELDVILVCWIIWKSTLILNSQWTWNLISDHHCTEIRFLSNDILLANYAIHHIEFNFMLNAAQNQFNAIGNDSFKGRFFKSDLRIMFVWNRLSFLKECFKISY